MGRQVQGHSARRRFGQNFLVSPGIICGIVDAIAPHAGDTVVEIGPGLGALTKPLLDRLDHLHVVEIDRDLIARLRQRWLAARLTIHEGDALEFDFGALRTDGPLKIVGNLPYNISSPLLFHLVTFAPVVHDMHFMLQKEVVDRMVAEPGGSSRGRLSVMLQYHYHIERLFGVPPDAFNPAPKVDSAIVRLIPKRLRKVVADEATDEAPAQQEGAGQNPARFAVDALQGGRAKNALMKPLHSRAVEQSTLGFADPGFAFPAVRFPLRGQVSSPLRILAVADGVTVKETENTVAKDETLFARIVAAAFSQRRKMLRNTLRALIDAADLAALGIPPTARAEELEVADFVRLADVLADRAGR